MIYIKPAEANEFGEPQEVGSEYVRMYYEHQYDRMAKLEEQGLTISNIVIAINVLAFTFGFSNVQDIKQDINVIVGIGLPLMMVISNFFAIIYIWCSGVFIRVHQARAKRVLKKYAQYLFTIDDDLRNPWRSWLGKRREIQLAIHVLLIFIAYIPAYLYLDGISSYWSKVGLCALFLVFMLIFITARHHQKKIKGEYRISSGILE